MEPCNDESLDSALRVVSFVLQEAATRNELLAGPNLNLTRFHTLSPPKIPIRRYLEYLQARSGYSKACLVATVILLDKLLLSHSNVQITPNTVHKMFLCSLMAATKFNTDTYYSNTAWAAIGGVRTEEMNVLELEFLFMLQFSLLITREEFEKYEKMIDQKLQCFERCWQYEKKLSP